MSWLPSLSSSPFRDDSKNNFERNQTDSFLLIKHKNMGALTRMKIGHDNSGPGPGERMRRGPLGEDNDLCLSMYIRYR